MCACDLYFSPVPPVCCEDCGAPVHLEIQQEYTDSMFGRVLCETCEETLLFSQALAAFSGSVESANASIANLRQRCTSCTLNHHQGGSCRGVGTNCTPPQQCPMREEARRRS